MKPIALCLALILASAAAQAETITLGTANCGLIAQCSEVPNDAALSIDLTYSANYRRTVLSIDGKQYDSGLYSLAQPFVNLPLTASDGSQAFLTASFTRTSIYISSGRAHYYATRWTLVGGTVVR